MPDNLTKCGLDGWRINVNERWEIDYWTEQLGVTPEELRQAVKEVGVMADDVRRHFGIEPRRKEPE
jgi:hypothetical protein